MPSRDTLIAAALALAALVTIAIVAPMPPAAGEPLAERIEDLEADVAWITGRVTELQAAVREIRELLGE